MQKCLTGVQFWVTPKVHFRTSKKRLNSRMESLKNSMFAPRGKIVKNHWYIVQLFESPKWSKSDFSGPSKWWLFIVFSSENWFWVSPLKSKPRIQWKWSTFWLFQKSASLSLDSRLRFEQRFPKSFLALKSVRQLCFWGRKVDTSKMNTCQALLDIFAQKCLTGVQFWENAKSTISGLKSCTMYQWFFTILPRCKTCSRCRRNAPLIWRNPRKSYPFKNECENTVQINFFQEIAKTLRIPSPTEPRKG